MKNEPIFGPPTLVTLLELAPPGGGVAKDSGLVTHRVGTSDIDMVASRAGNRGRR